MADDIRKVAEDSPDRCQGLSAFGQCSLAVVPGSDKCIMHGGAIVEKQNQRNYRLKQWQARTNEFADNPQIKSLREEIGILRILMEETVGKCHTTTDILLYSNKIITLVEKIEKVVVSCHKLEQSSNYLLDKNQLLLFADNVIKLIAHYIKDPDILEAISDRIPEAIEVDFDASDEKVTSGSHGDRLTASESE